MNPKITKKEIPTELKGLTFLQVLQKQKKNK